MIIIGPGGYRHDLEDFAYLTNSSVDVAKLPAAVEPPEELDRAWLRTEMQRRNDCAGHALSSAAECAHFDSTGGVVIQFSRHFAYRVGQEMAGLRGDVGCTIAGVVRAGREVGCCPEEVCPYPASYSAPITPRMRESAAKYRLGYHAQVRSYAEVFNFLAARQGGVVIGIPWDGQLAGGGEVVERWRYSSTSAWHALLIEGYSRRKDAQGRNYVWLRNSHGPQWGAGGRKELAPAVVDAFGRGEGVVMIGVSDLPGPMLRPDWGRKNYKWGGRPVSRRRGS